MQARDLFDLLEGAGDAAFAVDGQGKICYWSSAAEALLGFSAGETLSRPCSEIVAGLDEAGCQVCKPGCRVLEMARRNGKAPSYDLHAATRSGRRKWVNVSVLVARPGKGASPLVLHLMRDADRRKRLESVAQEVLASVHRWEASEELGAFGSRSGGGLRAELTSRELAVLRLMALGRSTRDIADELHISGATVRNHIQHVLEKLEAHTRLEAVVRAARQGLV